MCDGIVIDGHVIKDLASQLVSRNGVIYSLVSWITSNCGIAMSDYIKVHWEQHCGSRAKNTHFWEWYFDELHNKHTIHFVEVTRLDGRLWMNIRVRFSMPDDPFIRAVIECANSTNEPRYILAQDMYLYDAVAKDSDPSNQENIRENRNGPICKYLESAYHIIVGTPNHCKDYFAVDQGVCPNKSSNHITNCPRVSCD